jgi:DNA mismatch endonuclease (patch repair protein)
MPATNRALWKKKPTGNKQRDRYVTRQLRRQGWTVIRIWEHELVTSPAKCVSKIQRKLRNKS